MVAIPLGVVAPVLSPVETFRDWTPPEPTPAKGQYAFCVLLVEVVRKAKWQPASAVAVPSIVHRDGCCVWEWTASAESAISGVIGFNRQQMASRKKARGVKLWAMLGFGVCGFAETAEVVAVGHNCLTIGGGN